MKIEKVNDHQIRCTLTKADLLDRKLKISELAYGTEKAKSLFRDMMQQASYEFGFEADDIPLMIEAIPINSECIVLIITKVEDPEELDTRFSKFAPSVRDDDDSEEETLESNPTDEVLDLFRQLHEGAAKIADAAKEVTAADTETQATSIDATYIFTFENMSVLLKVAKLTSDWYNGESALYKSHKDGTYKLILRTGDTDAATFNKACNIMVEYGVGHRFSETGYAYLEEHFEALCEDNALSRLSQI